MTTVTQEIRERRVRDITIGSSLAWSGTAGLTGNIELRMLGGSYRDLTSAECRELAYQLTQAAREADGDAPEARS